MRIGLFLVRAAAVAALVGLGACVGAAPLALPPGHPASAEAAPGIVTLPTAFDAYRGPEDFGQ